MSSISPVNSSHNSTNISAVAARTATKPLEAPVRLTLAPVDSVDISDAARAAESSADRVSRVKKNLREGTYLHPDKLDIALDRMLERLGG